MLENHLVAFGALMHIEHGENYSRWLGQSDYTLPFYTITVISDKSTHNVF